MAYPKHRNWNRILELYRQGLTLREISEECDCASSTIGRVVKSAGLTRMAAPKGEVKRMVIDAVLKGYSIPEIVRDTGFKRDSVADAVTRYRLRELIPASRCLESTR